MGKMWTGLGNGYACSLLGVWTYIHSCIYIYRIIVQVIPLYLAEIAPKQHRGKLVSLSSTAASTGTLVGHYK